MLEITLVKGTLSQDFPPLVFFYQRTPSGPLIHSLFAYGFLFAQMFDHEIFGGQRCQ
jgi:hypothetical protein